MHQVQVTLFPRTLGKKSEVKTLRKQGLVPAVVYGKGIKNELCALNEKDLRSAFKNDLDSNLLIETQSEAGHLKGKMCILKKIDRSPLWNMEHVDLHQIDLNQPLSARVAVHYTGVPEGVKNDGGILQIIRRFVQIEALPSDLPDFIEVDITGLKLNGTLHVGEIPVPPKVKILDSKEFAIASVTEPEKEEVAAVAAVAADGTAAAPGTGDGAAAAAGTAPAAEDKDKKK